MSKQADAYAAAIRKKRADYMRAWNQRRGATAVKGTFFNCELCLQTFPKVDVKQRRCAVCRSTTFISEYNRTRRLAAGHVPIGTRLKCKNCSVEFPKSHKRHFYCGPCAELSAAEALPHQIENRRRRTARRMRERRQTTPRLSISARMSAGIRNSLRDGKTGRSWESLVGYTVTDLMDHLESLFAPGMGWHNRGKWHIDHRRPLASFSFETADDPDFKAAWALKNLQPLWALDNIRKSAKYDRESHV